MEPEMDVVINKKLSIERCVKQIHRYRAKTDELEQDFLVQDAIAANLQRVCELCIDLANYTIRKDKLGSPKSSSESFKLLLSAGIISAEMCEKLVGMVGFRNVLVHQYTDLNYQIFEHVLNSELEMSIDFAQIILVHFSQS